MKKFCVDCKWFDKNGRCFAPQNKKSTTPEPVYGSTSDYMTLEYAKNHRTGWGVSWLFCRINGYCGKCARWFKPKEIRITSTRPT